MTKHSFNGPWWFPTKYPVPRLVVVTAQRSHGQALALLFVAFVCCGWLVRLRAFSGSLPVDARHQETLPCLFSPVHRTQKKIIWRPASIAHVSNCLWSGDYRITERCLLGTCLWPPPPSSPSLLPHSLIQQAHWAGWHIVSACHVLVCSPT